MSVPAEADGWRRAWVRFMPDGSVRIDGVEVPARKPVSVRETPLGSQTQGPGVSAAVGPSETGTEPRTAAGRRLVSDYAEAGRPSYAQTLAEAVCAVEDEASALAESVTWQIALQQALTGDLRERE